MKWVMVVAGTLAALGLLVFVVGSAIEREHRARARITVPRPIDEVWGTVRRLDEIPTFWDEYTAVDRMDDPQGREVWLHRGSRGDLAIAVTEEQPPTRLVTTILSPPGAAFGGRWTYELSATPTGTQITVTEDGWIDNRLFRVVSKLTGYHGTLSSYLRAIGKKLGAAELPSRVGT